MTGAEPSETDLMVSFQWFLQLERSIPKSGDEGLEMVLLSWKQSSCFPRGCLAGSSSLEAAWHGKRSDNCYSSG
jgi:hypothetical protein